MKLHRFYIPLPLGEEEIRIQKIKKSEKVIDYIQKVIHQWKTVLRLKTGEEVILFNGENQIEYVYKIKEFEKDSCALSLSGVNEIEKKISREIILCMSIIKHEFDTVVRQATELGVTQIIPMIADRSEKKDVNLERLQIIAIEASEQCGRADVPKILAPLSAKEIVEKGNKAQHIILDMHGETLTEVKKEIDSAAPVYVWVGPEGGWTMNEINYFKNQNAKFASLPTYILKANTAGPVAVYSFL